jgi:SAM-dependent methyltransferase
MKRDALVEEYNNFFRRKPHKWTREESNRLAFEYLSAYLGSAPRSVIDIGCGNGHTVEYLSKKWEKTNFVGLDLSDVGIGLANARKIKRAVFVTGFADDHVSHVHFDVGILLGVAEHFDNPGRVLRDIRENLLAPGGVLYIEVPNCIAYPSSEPIEGFRRLACGSHQTEWHLHRPTWEDFLRGSGYTIERSITGPRQENEFIWIVKALPLRTV